MTDLAALEAAAVEYDPEENWLTVTDGVEYGATEVVGEKVPGWFGVRVVAAFDALPRLLRIEAAARPVLAHLERAAQDAHYNAGHEPTGWRGCATERCREVRDDLAAFRDAIEEKP